MIIIILTIGLIILLYYGSKLDVEYRNNVRIKEEKKRQKRFIDMQSTHHQGGGSNQYIGTIYNSCDIF